ncbi:MAG: hypothetical protein AAGF86_19305, partial [Pseudomonadota bacterium]
MAAQRVPFDVSEPPPLKWSILKYGTAFTAQQFQAMWAREMAKKPQEKVRKAGLSFHGLRKNAVVALAEAGCTTAQISAITGQTQRVVEHYLGTLRQGVLADQAMDV